jgi:hypothetical protein
MNKDEQHMKNVDNVIEGDKLVQEQVEHENKKEIYFRYRDDYCRGLLETTVCQAPIIEKGVNGSGFCECCWYPSIEEDYTKYKLHRKEGYGRTDAAIMAGIKQAPEMNKRVITYAQRKSDKRTDEK